MKFVVSDSLSLPDDAVTQKLAFIGRTGSGKTFAAGKLVEEMLDAGKQVVILDPVGVWYGLRMSADGGSGISIPVIGGLHADVPLEATGGALIADLVVDKHLSVVVDVSQFETDADKNRFAGDFASRLFFRKKSAPAPIHLVIEECQEFMPQNLMKGDERMLHAFQRMWKLGRNFGIGGSLISQRPQEVSKKVLNQTECLFAFQMTGPQERKAIEAWMDEKGVDQDIAGDLPSLRVGQCHVWSPQWLRINEKVVISKKRTLNSSSTPTAASARVTHRPAEIDLKDLAEKMRGTIERAKAEDPKELRREIAKLNAQLATVEKDARKIALERLPERVEVPVMAPKDMEVIERAGRVLADDLSYLRTAVERADLLLKEIRALNDSPKLRLVPPPVHLKVSNPPRNRDTLTSITYPRVGLTFEEVASFAKKEASNGLGAAERAFLAVLAQRQGKTTARNQLAVFSGYSSKSGHVDNTISSLRSKGLIDGSKDAMVITPQGLHESTDVPRLPQGRALIDYWIGKSGKAPGSMLRVLVDAYPKEVARDDLAGAAGYSAQSGHVDNCISHLRTLELLTGPKSALKASDELFQ